MDKNIVLNGMNTIEEQAMATDNHFLVGAAKGSLKRIAKSFEEKKKKAETDLANEKDATAKTDLQLKMSNYNLIVSQANDAIARVGKKSGVKKN